MNEIKVSHSELTAKQILDKYFSRFRKLDNQHLSWLEGLEIDRYYPDLGVAIEFQGDQHSRIVPGMHKGPEDFQRQIHLDTKKRQILESRGIRLYDINLLQLDRMRVLDLVKRIAKDGAEYALKKGRKDIHYKLKTTRFEEPETYLMRKVDRLSHIKKSYYKVGKKKSWLKKLFGI